MAKTKKGDKNNKPANTKTTKKNNEIAQNAATSDNNNTPATIQEAEIIDNEPIGGSIINKILEGGKGSLGNAPASHLSSDGAAMLAYTMQRKYFDNPDAKNHYTATFLTNMSAIQDGIIIGTIIQEVVTTNTPISLLIKKASYPQLRNLVEGYGIKLPELNELALPSKEELEMMKKFGITESNDGQLKIPFTPEDVDDNTKKIIKKEQEAVKKEVEMDPKKITSDEQASDALCKIYADRNIKGGIHKILLNAIHFVREYRFAQAERANDANMKAALESRTINDWLTDAITIKEPLLILKNVASTLCNAINKVGNPISAFLSFKSAITKNGVCPLKDEEIAMMTKSLVNWYVSFMSAEYRSQLNGGKKMTDKSRQALNDQLEYLKNVKEHLTEFDTEFVEKIMNVPSGESSANEKMFYYFTRQLYYGKEISGEKSPEEKYTNMAYNVMQRIAEIANLFLFESLKLEGMGEENILELKLAEPDKGEPEGNSDENTGDDNKKEDTGESSKN